MPPHAEMGVVRYGGWIVSKVQSLFWRRVTSLRRGAVSTGGGAFHLEDTTFCGGGVRFDLEEGVYLIWSRGSYFNGGGVRLNLEEGVYLIWSRGSYFTLGGVRLNLEEGV